MKTIDNLQILRAFAAINVAILHLIATASAYGFEPIYIGILKGWGNNGVDIFFVISGYLITSIILKELISTGSFSFKYFYERRIRRILPALLFVMFISFIFALNLSK